MDVVSETRIVVDKCRQDRMVLKPDYQTFASFFKSNGEKKGEDHAAPSDSTA